MILEIVQSGGIGKTKPIRIDASSIVVRLKNGTAFMVAIERDAAGQCGFATSRDADFQQLLSAAGVFEKVETLVFQVHPGTGSISRKQ